MEWLQSSDHDRKLRHRRPRRKQGSGDNAATIYNTVGNAVFIEQEVALRLGVRRVENGIFDDRFWHLMDSGAKTDCLSIS